jgi:hypothetical protein
MDLRERHFPHRKDTQSRIPDDPHVEFPAVDELLDDGRSAEAVVYELHASCELLFVLDD